MIYSALLLSLLAVHSALGQNGFSYLSQSQNKDALCPYAQTMGGWAWTNRNSGTLHCGNTRGCNLVSRNDAQSTASDNFHTYYYYCQNSAASAVPFSSGLSTKSAWAATSRMRSYFNPSKTLSAKAGCASRYGKRRHPDAYGEQTINRDYLRNTNSWKVEFQFYHNTKNDHVGLVDSSTNLHSGGFRIGFHTQGRLRWDWHTTNFGGNHPYRTGLGPVGDYRDGKLHDVVLTVEAGYGTLYVDGVAGETKRIYDKFSTRAATYTTKAYLGNDLCCGSDRKLDGIVQEFHLCALDNQPALKKENRKGMRPNCPAATGFGQCYDGRDCGYQYQSLEDALNTCEKSDNCNVVSHYGDSGTNHNWAFACPDLDNIEWVPQNLWPAEQGANSYPYVGTDARTQLEPTHSGCNGVALQGGLWHGKHSTFQVSDLGGSFTPGHDFKITFDLNLRNTGNGDGFTIIKNTVAVGACGFKYTLENGGYSAWHLHMTDAPASGVYEDRYISALNNRVNLKDQADHEIVLRLTGGKATVFVDGLSGDPVDVPTMVAQRLWDCTHGIEVGNDDGGSSFRGFTGVMSNLHFCALTPTPTVAACPDKPLSPSILSLLQDPNNELLYSCRDGKCASLSALFQDWEALDTECDTILGVDDDGNLYGTDHEGALITSSDQGATFSGADLLSYALDCGIHNAETGSSEVKLSYTNSDGKPVSVIIDQNDVTFNVDGQVLEYSNFYECL